METTIGLARAIEILIIPEDISRPRVRYFHELSEIYGLDTFAPPLMDEKKKKKNR